jgi:periplasmic protein TonB
MRPSRLVPIGDPLTWFTADDYPPSALRKNEQGTVRLVLHVDARGVPTSCSIAESSGIDTLDDTTCTIALRNARFQPPQDPANATWQRRVVWRLP